MQSPSPFLTRPKASSRCRSKATIHEKKQEMMPIAILFDVPEKGHE